MIKNIYHIPVCIFAVFLILGLVVMTPLKASAQYHGAYKEDQDYNKEKPLSPEYPKVFSSQVSSVQQAQKLDEIYDTLYASLWNCAVSDFNYQKQLYEQLENERFQITRYAGEFSGLLEDSMKNLNENHKKIQKAVEDANSEYDYMRERIRKNDLQTLDKLWSEKIAEFEKYADEYFKMQHDFLRSYHSLVAFILEQGGKYYYKSDDQTLRFFGLGVYEYYGKKVDKLRKISYEQIKLLKSHVPANMNPSLLK